MHMIFTGNPGSAKTTVARLFAQIMKENGLLSRGNLVEVGRSDLVGKYVGWTAKIVKQKFAEASGSVLFIDEAYSLVDDKPGLYGDEAINTIVQEMENNRSDIVVIFAGYTDKMDGFLAANPGLRSRIAFHVPFDDYSTPELCEILKFMAQKDGMSLSPDAEEKAAAIFEAAAKTTDFGNGRFVRNIFENAMMSLSSRLVAMNAEDITDSYVRTLNADDFEMPFGFDKPLARAIGFI
jgi:SpoVK/Ycf46/Vps4 family AAA+-type ATPase